MKPITLSLLLAGCAGIPCNAKAELEIDRACLREIVEKCRPLPVEQRDACRESIQTRCRERRFEAATCR